MNEQIRQLSQQAFNQVWELDSTPIGPGTHFVPDGFEQKFAELIVKECIGTVQKRCVGDHNREDAEVLRCVVDLKHHFGLTE